MPISFSIWFLIDSAMLMWTGEWRGGACFGKVRSCKNWWKV